MNKTFILFNSIFFSYCSLIGYIYNDLFMRDIAIFMDNKEKELKQHSSRNFDKGSSDTSPFLFPLAKFMFKIFLVTQKVKIAKISIYTIDNYFALVIPEKYVNSIKEKLNSYLKSNNLNVEDEEFLLGLTYKHFCPLANPFSSSSYRAIKIDNK